MRQKILRLEKQWVTRNGYFRIFTTIVGICVVDTWLAYKHHVKENHRHKKLELMPFVNMLIQDLLENDEPREVVETREEALVIGGDSFNLPDACIITDSSHTTNASQISDISALTSPTAGSSLSIDSVFTRRTMMLVELNSHQFQVTKRKTWERITKKTGRATKTMMVQRTARGYCNDCEKNGFQPRSKKSSQFCKGCKPQGGCLLYWICTRCRELHHDRISRSMYENQRQP